MDGTRPDALTDTQLNQELEAALGVEPSPEFVARVRTRVSSEPQPSLWRLDVARSFRWTSVEPLWAVAIAGIVLAIVAPQWIRDEKPSVTITAGRPFEPPPIFDGSDIGRSAMVGGASRVGVVATIPTRSLSHIQERPHGIPKVLISQDDRHAFDALLSAVAENRLPVRATPVEEAGSSLAIVPLQIQQLRIEPLHVARLEGVNGL